MASTFPGGSLRDEREKDLIRRIGPENEKREKPAKAFNVNAHASKGRK